MFKNRKGRNIEKYRNKEEIKTRCGIEGNFPKVRVFCRCISYGIFSRKMDSIFDKENVRTRNDL